MLAQGLVAARDAGHLDAGLGQPALGDLGALAPAEAVERPRGVGLRPGAPGFDTCLPGVAADQAMAQAHGGVVPLLLVAAAHPLSLVVV